MKIKSALRNACRELGYGSILIGIASLVWLLIRTGLKPSRAAYPCQRAALTNVLAALSVLAIPTVWRGPAIRTARWSRGVLLAAAILSVVIIASGPGLFSAFLAMQSGQAVSVKLSGHQLAAATYSDIFAVQGTTGADGGFQRLVDLMEQNGLSFYSLIGPQDVVIIKVNSQWDERGGTNTDLVRAITESILRHPRGFTGEVVIADNGQAQAGSTGTGGSLDWKSSNAQDRTQSMQKVADSFAGTGKVSTALWDRITATRVSEYSEGDARSGYVVGTSPSPETGLVVSYPKFQTPWSTLVSFKRGIWNSALRSYDSDRLKVINVPVLKSHLIYGVTASVKHYMGVVSEKLTRSGHSNVGSGAMGTEIAETRVPVLNVIDAIWINAGPGKGPATRYADASQAGIIAAGRDPVALDYWAAKNILVPAAKELGYKNVDTINPDVTKSGYFGAWLRLSMKELQRAGFPSTVDLDGVNITVR